MFKNIITIPEISKEWGIAQERIKYAIRVGKFTQEECGRSGAAWLLSIDAVIRVFGPSLVMEQQLLTAKEELEAQGLIVDENHLDWEQYTALGQTVLCIDYLDEFTGRHYLKYNGEWLPVEVGTAIAVADSIGLSSTMAMDDHYGEYVWQIQCHRNGHNYNGYKEVQYFGCTFFQSGDTVYAPNMGRFLTLDELALLELLEVQNG